MLYYLNNKNCCLNNTTKHAFNFTLCMFRSVTLTSLFIDQLHASLLVLSLSRKAKAIDKKLLVVEQDSNVGLGVKKRYKIIIKKSNMNDAV